MNDYKTAQYQFFFDICRLGLWLKEQGFYPSGGEWMRGKQQAEWNALHGLGIANSLHIDKLAFDIIIRDENGSEISIEEYRRIGIHWKEMDVNHAYGGDFGDYHHFSRMYGGRR